MQITADDVDAFAVGATVLGTGGGGDPHLGKLMAIQAIEEHGPVELRSPTALPDDALIVPCAMLGSPAVVDEKLPGGTEQPSVFAPFERDLGREPDATMSIEAGGINGTVPIAVAAERDLPLVDADAMGRAFPRLHMSTLSLGGVSATPMNVSDEKGNTVFAETRDNELAERFARVTSIEMGGTCTIAAYPHSGRTCRDHAVLESMTFVREIGAAIRAARDGRRDPVEALREATDGTVLVNGKVATVDRRTDDEFPAGSATVESLEDDGRDVRLAFRNEYLLARRVDGDVVASVPDLVVVLDAETAEPITTEALAYGSRVTVVGIPCADRWRTDRGLELVGPAQFGYDVQYSPLDGGRGSVE